MTFSVPIATGFTAALGVTHPIVSAPMAGVAGGGLAAAVSRAGGLGLIGGGYGDEAWLRREFALAGDADVGCGFITWALAERPALLDLALSHRPVAVMLSFGDPTPFAGQVKSAGAQVICQVQDLRQADQALQAGADVLVAQGSEAGGHGCGTRSTLTLVPEIVDLVGAAGRTTPVLAAGGIADGRGLAAALMLGAAGVLCGTRFYAATEALSTAPARGLVAAADGDSTCRTDVFDIARGHHWPPAHTMNALRNAFTDRWHGVDPDPEQMAAQYRAAVDSEDYRVAAVIVGQATGLIHDSVPAAQIVTELAGDAARLLSGSRLSD